VEEKLYNNPEYAEIRDLVKRIEKAAFKIALGREKSPERSAEILCFNPTGEKGSLSYRWVRIWKSDIEKNDVEVIAKIINQFISELAKRIWNHNRRIKFPDLTREYLMKRKKREHNFLDSYEKLLESRRYKSETIQKTLEPLRAELDAHIDWASQSKVLQSEVPINGHDLVEFENIAINQIRPLYKIEELQADGSRKAVSLFNTNLSSNPITLNQDGSPKLEDLSDRQIDSNMAIIFSVTDFWGDKPSDNEIANNEKLIENRRRELYFGRLRKRPKTIKIDDYLRETDFNW
jgi:hypothetical protein